MTSARVRQGAFISYARADGEAAARALQARLQAEAPDVPAWLDRLELEGGVGWWKQIEAQLERAEFLILVMTPAALRSENTRREWRSARQQGVCVYPVKAVDDLDWKTLPRWMRKAHFYDPQIEWPKLLAHLRRGCQTTRVPFMAPVLPTNFVERPRETEALIDLLLKRTDNAVAITTALRGAGGFGKTTLAAAVCHDDRVLDAFDDGILWVTLGQSPNLLNELTKLHAALTGDRPAFVDVDDAARELASKLENRNCLVVIDDAWNSGHVAPFLRGGAGCARLITTRLFEVAEAATRVDVDEMELAEATRLLLARAGATPDDEEPFRRLAGRLGGWPLPIKLVGSAIRQRIARGDTPAKALDYAVRSLDKRGITAFDKADAAERADAVTSTVGASLDLLTADEQRRCAELSIFPEDTAIPLAAARALWQLDDIDTEDLARRLDDLALLEFDLRVGTLRMHDVLRAFLAGRVVDSEALHARLIDAWGNPFGLGDPYAWRRYTFHLHRAGRSQDARALLLDPDWLAAKLRATAIQWVIGDFETIRGDEVLDLVRDALRLSASAVMADPRQLQTQLVARLFQREEAEIVSLRERLEGGIRGAWLKPIHPALDAPGGMLLVTLVGHEGGVTAVASGAGGRKLLSASSDGGVQVWDSEQGQLLQTLRHRSGLATTALSPNRDVTLALSGGADGFLYLWDIERSERISAFRSERGPGIRAVALSGNGRIGITGSRDCSVRIWDVEARTGSAVLEGHTEPVTAVALSHEGHRGISGSEDGTVRVWNVATRGLERTLEGHAGTVNAVAISADGRVGLSGASDCTVKVWDLDSGSCVRTLKGHAASVTSLSLADQGARALSGSSDQTAVLWDLQTGATLATLYGHSDVVTAVWIDPSGTRAATGSTDRSIKIWRLDALHLPLVRSAHAGAVTAIVFSGDGRLCASGGGDGRIIIHEVASGHVLQSIEAHSGPVRSLAFTEDATCVLSSGVDQVYRMWTVEDGSGVWLPVRHTAPVDYCALSGRARYLTTSCSDQSVYVWEMPSGVLVERYGTRRLFDHLIVPSPRRQKLLDEKWADRYLAGEDVYTVALIKMSHQGDHAVLSATVRDTVLARDKTSRERACLLVLHLRSGQVQSLTAHAAEPLTAFAVNDTATHLVWAEPNHELHVWDLDRGEQVATMRGHTEKVNAVCYSRDGRHIVSCGRDRTVRMWDATTGASVALYTADSAVRSLAVSPHGDAIAVGDMSGRLHFLRLEESTAAVAPIVEPGGYRAPVDGSFNRATSA